MSITLEEIRDEVADIKSRSYGGSKAYTVAANLMNKLESAIAERAEPVTREWLDETFPKPIGIGYLITVGDKSEFHLSLASGATIHLADIESRGQLLDLLSGLGVKK